MVIEFKTIKLNLVDELVCHAVALLSPHWLAPAPARVASSQNEFRGSWGVPE